MIPVTPKDREIRNDQEKWNDPSTWIDPEASTSRRAGFDGSLGAVVVNAVRDALRMAVWAVLTVTVLLGSWVGFGWWIGGWTPVTITSGSMAPALQVGDVLLVSSEGVDVVGQRSIIVFERDDSLIAHRVFSVEGDRLVTKGDANVAPDTDEVVTESVVGVGRLVVPLIGRPIVWAADGAWVWLGTWAVLLITGVARLAIGLQRRLTRAPTREPTTRADRRHDVGRRGIQRVRVIVALLVAMQHLIGRDDGAIAASGGGALTVLAIVVLLATNIGGSIGERRGGGHSRLLALAELGVDTILVVVLAMSTGSEGSTWVLLSLPIIEAAVRFRLVGALIHWMLLTTVSAAAKIWEGAGDPSSMLLADLDRVVDQLSVLLLVVVPAAYLAEQLIGEVRTWQDATGLAEDRGHLLVQVADLSRDISRLDDAGLDVILAGVRSLGFDRCDMVFEDGVGGWQVAGGDPLPSPGRPASCVGPELAPAAFVDAADPDETEVNGLHEAGLAAIVAHVVGVHDGRRLVLRSGLDAGRTLGSELVEAFRLLAGQASVALRNDQLMSEVTSIHAELEHQATHDALTGLPNRALLLQRLDQLSPSDPMPALMFLDLNGFKPVNDRLGHDAGDAVLRRVADRLTKVVPPGATVARLGGDEFTVLLPSCPDLRFAIDVSQTIADEIGRPFDLEQGLVNIGTAIGIAFGGADVEPAELIRRADIAMYEAKHGPRPEPYELYRPELDGHGDRRDVLLADIEAAIVSGGVRLDFQPIVAMQHGSEVVGAEALVRWQHPTLGAVASREIVDTARAAGVTSALTRHVLVGACAAATHWRREQPSKRCFVAVNASADELSDSAFPVLIRKVLAASELPPDLLHVEINERVVVSGSENVHRNISALRALGVQVVLDDVGQVNLSMSSLSAFPLSGAKIDRRVVVGAMRSETDRVVLRSVVELCHRLGQVVIAGGIESDEQARVALDAGCTLLQGFHLGVPQSSDQIGRLLAATATATTAATTAATVAGPTRATVV